MILYLYIPPVIISQLFSATIMLSIRIYVFILSLMSFSMCYFFVRRIFLKQDNFIENLFLITLIICFLILPFNEFGQKEHLYFIFSMPYVLAIAYRLQGNMINTYFAIAIGLMAGVGFAIKPHFLITPIFLELYYVFCKRNILAWIRPEVLSIIGLLCIYTVIAFIIHPDYFSIMLPYILRLFYPAIAQPLFTLLLSPLPVISYSAILLYLIQYPANPYKILCTTLVMALISFLLSFIIQRVLFYYHLLPFFSLTMLLLVLLVSFYLLRIQISTRQRILMIALAILLASYLSYNVNIIWALIVFRPNLFFCFFALLFSFLFYLAQERKKFFKAIFLVSIIILVSYYFSYVIRQTSWYAHDFLMTVLLLFGLFVLLVPEKSKNRWDQLLIAIVATLFFSFPFLVTNNVYSGMLEYKDKINKISSFIKANMQNKSVYLFATGGSYLFPVIDYAGVTSVSRFPFLWMVPALVMEKGMTMDANAKQQRIKDKDFLINMIAQDLNRNTPDFIFVDINKYKSNLGDMNFDFLNYFSQNKNFQQAWKCYHYFTTITGNPSLFESRGSNYKFAIYQRSFCPNNL